MRLLTLLFLSCSIVSLGSGISLLGAQSPMIENDQMGPIQIVSVDQVALETPWKDGVIFEERIKLHL